ALAAVFMTPRWTSRVVDAPGKNDAAIKKLLRLRGDIRREMAASWRKAAEKPVVKWKAGGKAPAIEEVSHPLSRLASAEDVVGQWQTLAAEWRKARGERSKHNEAFTILADFAKPAFPKGWVTEGDGIRFGHVPDGTPLIALEGDAVFARLLPRGYHTHALS